LTGIPICIIKEKKGKPESAIYEIVCRAENHWAEGNLNPKLETYSTFEKAIL
jgi:hypothetical protein